MPVRTRSPPRCEDAALDFAPAARAEAEAVGRDAGDATQQSHACGKCGAGFASRNALFRHLRASCEPRLAASGRVQKERVALVVGYVGSRYHGCALNDRGEDARPTVEGALLRAVRHAWALDEACGPLAAARCTRTERGAHALENVVVLTLPRSPGAASTAPRRDAAEVRAELEGSGIALLGLASTLTRELPHAFDKVHAAKKRVFRCYVPYFALMPSGRPGAIVEEDAETACSVWLGPVPIDCEAPLIAALIAAHTEVRAASSGISVAPGDGHAEVSFEDEAAALAACKALDGLEWQGQRLFALPLVEAQAKFRIQRRVRTALKQLRGPARGLRSFHSFMPETQPGDGQAMRQLQHCAAGSLFAELRGSCRSRWAESDWTSLTFSASDFGPQQLRRMAGALVAVVRGTEGEDYLGRCFDPEGPPVDTLPAPTESICLESVDFGARAGDWRSAVSIDAQAAATIRDAVEERIRSEACRPWRDFVSLLDGGATRAQLVQRLWDAASSGDCEGVRTALDAGALIDARNQYGQTAAMLAALAGHAEVVQALASKSADLALAANGGVSPSLAASYRGHVEVLRVLARHGDPTAEPLLSSLPSTRPSPAAAGPSGDVSVTTVIPLGAQHAGAGTVYVDGAFEEALLGRLDALWRELPVAPKEKTSSNERSYFADVAGWVTSALDVAVACAGLPQATASVPLMRFLWYPHVGGALPAHVDLPRKDASGIRSTYTFLLYLQDCEDGGETHMLECLDGDEALAASGGVAPGPRGVVASVTPRRGRLLLFPHICPHSAAPVVDVPKVLLRGEVMPPAPRASEEGPQDGVLVAGRDAAQPSARSIGAAEGGEARAPVRTSTSGSIACNTGSRSMPMDVAQLVARCVGLLGGGVKANMILVACPWLRAQLEDVRLMLGLEEHPDLFEIERSGQAEWIFLRPGCGEEVPEHHRALIEGWVADSKRRAEGEAEDLLHACRAAITRYLGKHVDAQASVVPLAYLLRDKHVGRRVSSYVMARPVKDLLVHRDPALRRLLTPDFCWWASLMLHLRQLLLGLGLEVSQRPLGARRCLKGGVWPGCPCLDALGPAGSVWPAALRPEASTAEALGLEGDEELRRRVRQLLQKRGESDVRALGRDPVVRRLRAGRGLLPLLRSLFAGDPRYTLSLVGQDWRLGCARGPRDAELAEPAEAHCAA